MRSGLYIVVILCFASFFLSAQKDLKYFLDGNKKFVDSTQASFYVIYKINPDTLINAGSADTYLINGKILKHSEYKYNPDGSKKENQVYYFPNGKVGERITAIDREDEERLAYFPNGVLKRKAIYKNDTPISEYCYGWKGKDTACYEEDLRKPQFIGGPAALDAFIKKNLNYPEEAKQKKISGMVRVAVIIDRQGGIESLSLQEKLDPLLDAEAIRVIRSMPRWMPGLYRDQLLPTYQSVIVNFELPKN